MSFKIFPILFSNVYSSGEKTQIEQHMQKGRRYH